MSFNTVNLSSSFTMAWFQNLAGKAEDLLNKIDQNAATVLHDSTNKLLDISTNIIEPFDPEANDDSNTLQVLDENKRNNLKNEIENVENDLQNADELDTCFDKSDLLPLTNVIINNSGKVTPIRIFEKDLRNESCDLSSKSDSITNNHQIIDELQIKLEEKIMNLEYENQELNRQILTVQHLHSEEKNENGNLKIQLERASERVLHAQNEMEQYKVRAQRILQEKENLISFKKEDFIESNEQLSVISIYNEELKKDLEFQQAKNKELLDKNNNTNSELNELQEELASVHSTHYKELQNLQQMVSIEKKYRHLAEEECKSKLKDLNINRAENIQMQKLLEMRNKTVDDLKEQIKETSNFQSNIEADMRIRNLKETLLTKQNSLEAVTSERNAFRLQLEKLQRDYNRVIECQLNKTTCPNVNDIEEGRSYIPKLTVVSPLDVGVTRKVKHTFSTLDAISIRTGVFLRRYPVARIFVFCYMILLHIWVLIILFTYIPTR